jgi:hypothetical protein
LFRNYFYISGGTAIAFFLKGVAFRDEDGFFVGDFVKLILPRFVLFFRGDWNFDEDIFFIVFSTDKYPIDKYFVIDFGSFIGFFCSAC